MLSFGALWWKADAERQQTALAESTAMELMQRLADRRNSAEMRLALAKLKLGVEGSPEQALQAVEQAQALAPSDPDILADRAACLLASWRVADALAAAQAAWPLQRTSEGRVLVAAIGWAAARIFGNDAARVAWARRALGAYDELPAGDRPFRLHPGAIKVIGDRKVYTSPHHALAVTEAIRILKIIAEEKTPGSTAAVHRLLEPPA